MPCQNISYTAKYAVFVDYQKLSTFVPCHVIYTKVFSDSWCEHDYEVIFSFFGSRQSFQKRRFLIFIVELVHKPCTQKMSLRYWLSGMLHHVCPMLETSSFRRHSNYNATYHYILKQWHYYQHY